ncbi:MAG: serine hydrolase [Patescibacteria group bacterium]|nr:serine hydrolase [Patescibacteria group bacterium]
MNKENEQNLREKDFGSGQALKRRVRKTIGEEGSRKQTLIGLAVTIILGLMFYLPPQLKQWWQEIDFNFSDGKENEVIRIERKREIKQDISEIVGFKVEIKKKTDAETVIATMLTDKAGQYGIYVESLEGGESIKINESQKFTAASVGKLPLLIAYYQAVDKGKIDPETVYVLEEKDRWVYGTGSMQNSPAGAKFSYQEVADLTANQSDNMGAQLLQKWLKTTMPEEMTPKEAGNLWRELYQDKLINKQSKEKLFKSLTETVNEDRIPAGVPEGIRVIHKFGSETGVVNDCGIVEAKSAYVICMMSTEINAGEAQELLPKISRVVWEWLGK